MLLPALVACLPVHAQPLHIADTFDAAALSEDSWRLAVGGNNSVARLEPRDGGQCLHLLGDRAATELATREPIPDIAYTLEWDFLQPAQEVGGYQAVVTHRRPEGNSYWWLEYGPERFFLYTVAGGVWFNRWQAYGFPTECWFHVRVQNTPASARVSLFDGKGEKLLAESPPIPHDEGDAGPIAFAAMGLDTGPWGMRIDNVHLSVTPVAERDDFRHREASLKAAQEAVAAERTRELWPESAAALQPAVAALEAIGRVPPEDWAAYVRANETFDAALREVAQQLHDRVLAKLATQDGRWVLVDLWQHYDTDAGLAGVGVPGPGPVVSVSGCPFLQPGFGRNCLLEDMPSRTRRAIKLPVEAKRIALLLAPLCGTELYAHDDSLVDVLQVELRYEDGFRERIVPGEEGAGLAAVTPKLSPTDRAATAAVVEPGHRAKLSEIVLCDDATQAGWALLGLSYEPGLPDEVPVIRALPQAGPGPKPGPTKLSRSADKTVIENRSLRLTFDPRQGLLRGLWGAACGDLIGAEAPSPIFAVKLGDRLVYSDEFTVTGVERTKQGAELHLRGPGSDGALEITLAVGGSTQSGVTLGASLRNTGAEVIEPRLIFPLLDGLDLGEKPGWWFPQRGGAASDLPLEGLSSYGGMAWLQLLEAHRAAGGGLYLRCDDTSGEYKVFGLRSSPTADARPRRIAEIPEPVHAVDPWRAPTGVHLSVQYLPRKLAPGGSWSPPSATLSPHPGDWHAALRDYRAWLKTWWKQVRPCPDVYRYGFYALVGGTPGDDQRGEEFGSYDWWHLSPLWTIDYPDELARELDELRKQGERASKWGERVGVYIEGMCLEKKRRIAGEQGAEWAMKDDRGGFYTYYSTDSNPVWNMCPAVKEWQQWDAAAYAEIARRVPLCAMYVDSTGSRWSEVCYNPAHHHETPGIWPSGCGELFESIRQSVMGVSPETAIHSEEPGCDLMALHEDGSWSHSLWTSVSGDAEYNPAGLNYFHFALPEFKLYEIPSYRHGLWRCKLAFFNGEGLWTSRPDPLRRELFIRWFPTLREHAETFLSDDLAPALPLVAPPLYLNAFRRGPQAIYTVYNAGLRTRTAWVVLDVPNNARLFDLLELTEVEHATRKPGTTWRWDPDPETVRRLAENAEERRRGGRELPYADEPDVFDLLSFAPDSSGVRRAVLKLTLDPHEVKCLLATPRLMNAEVQGDTLRVSLPNGLLGGRLCAALIDEQGVRRQAQDLDVGQDPRELTLELPRLFGEQRGRVLLRLAGEHATADELCVAWR